MIVLVAQQTVRQVRPQRASLQRFIVQAAGRFGIRLAFVHQRVVTQGCVRLNGVLSLYARLSIYFSIFSSIAPARLAFPSCQTTADTVHRPILVLRVLSGIGSFQSTCKRFICPLLGGLPLAKILIGKSIYIVHAFIDCIAWVVRLWIGMREGRLEVGAVCVLIVGPFHH